MKINKTICIDIELYDQLENINASSLISALLIKHFDNSNPEKKKQNIQESEVEINKQLEELNGKRIELNKEIVKEENIKALDLNEQKILYINSNKDSKALREVIQGYNSVFDENIQSLDWFELIRKVEQLELNEGV